MTTETKQRRIYVASSWRNHLQQGVVHTLRAAGHDVYDFRNPGPGKHGFKWYEVDPNWQQWTPAQYRDLLDHPISVDGFNNDYSAMEWADTCVLVLPCGRSAHIEAGYFNGAKKDLFILQLDVMEPELMYRMATHICVSVDDLLNCVGLVKGAGE